LEEDEAMTEINLRNFALTRGSVEAQVIKQLRRSYQARLDVASGPGSEKSDFLWGIRNTLRGVIADLDVLLHDEDQ
jgi:hypothetical protein